MKGNSIIFWTSKRRNQSNLRVERIPLSSIKNWNFNGKNISYNKNYFFSIIGVKVYPKDKSGFSWEQPIILQNEIGILGFIIQDGKILLHAKTEPGNINGTQIGPTVQATVSNYKQVHGGDKTKFLQYFLNSNGDLDIVSNSIQLEQGTKFLT